MSRRRQPPKLEWFAWYATKYAADTTHLSREADYAYRRIIDHIFIHDQRTFRVVDDDALLRGIARATSAEWVDIRHALIDGPAALLAKDDGGIFSPRLMEEIRKAKVKTKQARDAAEARWGAQNSENLGDARAKRKHSGSNADALRTQSAGNASKRESKTLPPSSEEKRKKKNILNAQNGNGHVSETQFHAIVSSVNKWADETRERFVGGDGGDYWKAFEVRFKMSREKWEAMQARFA